MIIRRIAIILVMTLAASTILFLFLLRDKNYIKIHSIPLSETRKFLVHLPEGYDSSTRRYPVLYMLDGGDVRIFSKDISRYSKAMTTLKNLDHSKYPEMILIGIANTNRMRDMLPIIAEESGTGGEADKFLQFIENELIPHIDRNYRTTRHRTLYGMSDSGLFAVYAFLTAPDSFSAYIASSPTLGRCSKLLAKKADELFESRRTLEQFLYIIHCQKDSPYCSPAIPDFEAKLSLLQSIGLHWQVQLEDGACHIPDSSLAKGLEYIWSEEEEMGGINQSR